jgi:hypothetical protein
VLVVVYLVAQQKFKIDFLAEMAPISCAEEKK